MWMRHSRSSAFASARTTCLHVKSEKDGYLYVLQHGTDGVILQVFPNELDEEESHACRAEHHGSAAGQSRQRSWILQAGGPAGTDTMIAIVSTNPRDFSATGMKYSDRFLQTTRAAPPKSRAAAPAASRSSSASRSARACDDIYGARVLRPKK